MRLRLLVPFVLIVLVAAPATVSHAEETEPTLEELKAAAAGDPDHWKRTDAVEDIAKRFFDPENLVPWLRERLRVERYSNVRLALAYALAAQGEMEGLRTLVDALKQTGHLGYVYLTRVSERDFGGPKRGWNRPAWVEWLAEVDETGWRELQRKRRLPREPSDGDLAGLERATQWWNGLEFPDVAKLPFVRVYHDGSSADDEESRAYAYGFLIHKTEQGFRAFSTDLAFFDVTYEVEDEYPRPRLADADLAADVRRDLEVLGNDRRGNRNFDVAERDPFGVDCYWTPHRFRGFVLAVALHGRGEVDLAVEVWRHLARKSEGGPRYGRWSALALLQNDVRSQTYDLWRMSLTDASRTWKEGLDAYRTWRARFSEEADAGKEDDTERVLARMAAEESGYEAAARGEADTAAERARLLVFALPTVSDSETPDVLARLVDLGTDAVPALIPALDDDRFTKSIVWNFPHKGYFRPSFGIERVRELAYEALVKISQQSFGGEGGWDGVREAVEAWWEAYQTQGESAVLVAGVRAADASSPGQARRLVEKYPDEAFAVIRAALETAEGNVAVRLLGALSELRRPEVRTYLEARAREGHVRERMAAARALHAHGSPAGLEALLGDWPAVALRRLEGPSGVALPGLRPVFGLIGLFYATVPRRALERMRRELDVTPAPLKFEMIREIRSALGRPQAPEVHEAAQALLIELVLDPATRDGKFYVSSAEDAMVLQSNHVGELAAEKLARHWPDRYAYDPKAPFRERLAQRYTIVNTWRTAHGLDPLDAPTRPKIEPVPAAILRPLLDLWHAAAEGDDRERAAAAIHAMGLGTIPVLEAELVASTDPEAKTRLDALIREAAAIVREVLWAAEGPDPDPAWRKRVAALEGRPIRGRDLTGLFRQCALGLPDGVTGIDLRLDRSGDDTGYVLKIGLTTHRVPWRTRGRGGFILGGDGQELVDAFLKDADSWWHESRAGQLDAELLAPADQEVHLRRSFVRTREP